MKEINSNHGITLVTLVITVIVLCIVMTVSINIFQNYSDSLKLKKFNTQLDTVQLRVNEISNKNESYISEDGSKIYLKNLGRELTSNENMQIKNITLDEGEQLTPENFRFFSKEDLESELGIYKIDQDVFIDFENKIVVSVKGLKIGDKTYYISTNQKYVINKQTELFEVPDSVIKIESVSDDTCNIKIDDATAYFSIKYRIKGEQYWKSIINKSCTVEKGKTYEIIFVKIDGSICIKEILT